MNKIIADYPAIGIRPIIDARMNGIRESLEDKVMGMAVNVAELISSELRYPDGSPVKCVIADGTIGRVAEHAQSCHHCKIQDRRNCFSQSLCQRNFRLS